MVEKYKHNPSPEFITELSVIVKIVAFRPCGDKPGFNVACKYHHLIIDCTITTLDPFSQT